MRGARPSAVDLGRLQQAIEAGLASFDMDMVRERWEHDVRAWLERLLLRCIQRCKSLRLDPRDSGIRVEIETQADLGYYTYGFSVFPGRMRDAVLPSRP